MSDKETTLKALADLEPTAFQRLLARLSILRAYVRHRETHRLSDAQAQEDITERLSKREAEVEPWVHETYDGVSGRTLRRWEERFLEGGLVGLADDHGRRSERSYASYFDPGTEMRKIALYFLADHPECTSTDLLDELHQHFAEEELPDRRTVQRFLAKMGA